MDWDVELWDDTFRLVEWVGVFLLLTAFVDAGVHHAYDQAVDVEHELSVVVVPCGEPLGNFDGLPVDLPEA